MRINYGVYINLAAIVLSLQIPDQMYLVNSFLSDAKLLDPRHMNAPSTRMVDGSIIQRHVV